MSGAGVLGTVIASAGIFSIAQGYILPEGGILAWENAPLMAMVLLFASSNGIFVVPLMAALQERAPADRRARIMGTSNMTNGGLATLGAALLIPMREIGLAPDQVFAVIGLMQAGLLFVMWRRRGAIRAKANPLTQEVISPTFRELPK